MSINETEPNAINFCNVINKNETCKHRLIIFKYPSNQMRIQNSDKYLRWRFLPAFNYFLQKNSIIDVCKGSIKYRWSLKKNITNKKYIL